MRNAGRTPKSRSVSDSVFVKRILAEIRVRRVDAQRERDAGDVRRRHVPPQVRGLQVRPRPAPLAGDDAVRERVDQVEVRRVAGGRGLVVAALDPDDVRVGPVSRAQKAPQRGDLREPVRAHLDAPALFLAEVAEVEREEQDHHPAALGLLEGPGRRERSTRCSASRNRRGHPSGSRTNPPPSVKLNGASPAASTQCGACVVAT